MSTSLLKGQNTVLSAAPVSFTVKSTGLAVDVSALLLGAGGKVRGDDDLVFYNHPQHDGVSISGNTVTADLNRLPADVATVAVVVSVDPQQPGAVFTTAPHLTITQPGTQAKTFIAPDFTVKETVVVLAELYRRGDEWKARAVGQGYASGLAGLATDYGVDIDDPGTQPPGPLLPPQTRSAATDAAVNLTKVERQAPALLEPARQASQALVRTGLEGRRAAVYLVLDHDWHMEELYESFAVQAFAERVLALSANLDDGNGARDLLERQGTVPRRDPARQLPRPHRPAPHPG